MTTNGLTPGDAELIAAFLDKRLSETERQSFLERLDNEEALYEVFVETVRYREEEARSSTATVVEHPAARERSRWLIPSSVAAVLALAVLGPFLLRDSAMPTGGGFPRALVEDGSIDGVLTGDW